jgi:hypothetical protein
LANKPKGKDNYLSKVKSLMTMDEELLNDDRFPQLSQIRQSEIIARRCRGVQQLIRGAHSRTEAVRIADDACRLFADECESEIVQNALMQHVQQMVEKFWGKR